MFQIAEERILRRPKPHAAKLLVVEPGNGSRCLPQGVAQARRSDQWLRFTSHIKCICKHSETVTETFNNSGRLLTISAALGRVGLPDDIGPMIALLFSEDNRWINGQRIKVSGGMVL